MSEIHACEYGAFLAEVHSFEFWFQTVEGYLRDRPYGRAERSELREPELSPREREGLIATLCNYCVGETAALEGASGMIAFAPTRQAKIFLATQAIDEARHLEVFLHRLAELGVDDPEREIARHASRSLLSFKEELLRLVAARDWEAAVFAQNVILESMEFCAFVTHMTLTRDAKTAEILGGVLKDERRHMGFGENDLGRKLLLAPHVRARLEALKRRLDTLVLETFEETMDHLGMPRADRPELGRHYLETVRRLGFGA